MKILLGLIFFWGFGWFWLRLEIIKFVFFFEVILVGWDKKIIKLLQRCQETCLIDAKKHNQFVWTCLNVHTIFWKMWTKTWNYGQKYEIIDKNMKYTFWIHLNFISRLEMFVHNFMFLSIISCFCPHFSEIIWTFLGYLNVHK